jgi:hypothetical protein
MIVSLVFFRHLFWKLCRLFIQLGAAMPQTGAAWVEMNLNKVLYSVNATLKLTQNLYLLWDAIGLVFQTFFSTATRTVREILRVSFFSASTSIKIFDLDFPQCGVTEESKFRRRPVIVTMYDTLEFGHISFRRLPN